MILVKVKKQINFVKDISSHENKKVLKVVSATFLLVCFVSLKESTGEARKNVFYFISKDLFRYSNVMTSSNA